MIIYNFLKFLIMYIRYNRVLNDVYKKENILEGLSSTLGTELKQDWIGRLYAVVNPYIVDGKYDPSKIITEIGKDIPTNMVLEKYVMERFNIASQFIQTNNLFDLMTYKMTRLDEYENYLLVLYPLPYSDLVIWGKRLLIELVVLMIILIGLFVVI